MTLMFYALAGLLTVATLAALLRPLLRPPPEQGQPQQRMNAAVYREQLAALERELAQQAIGRAEYESSRNELQLRLLEDEKAAAAGAAPPARAGFWTTPRSAWALALALPLGAAGMYGWLGAPAAIDAERALQAQQDDIQRMVDGLAARLRANPDNPQGWAMLARSYKVLGRLEEAEQAYARIGPMLETNPDLLAHYADLLAARHDSFDGRPAALLQQALALNPSHPMALMLAGTAAYREADYATAAARWEQLLAVLEPGTPDAEQVQADLEDARARARTQPAAASPPVRSAAAGAAMPADHPPVAAARPQAALAPVQEGPDEMVARLAARLQAQPDDPAGWARLARSYKVLGRLQEAEEAYARAGKLVDSDPSMLTDLADLLATRAGGSLEGRPLTLVQRALALDPQHRMGLMLAGTAAFRRGDYEGAIAQWEKLRPAFLPGSRDAEWLAASLADARLRAGRPAN